MAPRPQVAQLLGMLGALDGPALHEMEPVEARPSSAGMAARASALN